MDRRRKRSDNRLQAFPVWPQDQALRATPYITSLVRSLRETYLEFQGQQVLVNRYAEKDGRADRHTLIAHEDAVRDMQSLESQLEEITGEMNQLSIHSVDPVNGVVMIPFVKEDQLAWMVFELFEQDKIRHWRYNQDPLKTRRPLGELQAPNTPASVIV